jgi:hypothetical protein
MSTYNEEAESSRTASQGYRGIKSVVSPIAGVVTMAAASAALQDSHTICDTNEDDDNQYEYCEQLKYEYIRERPEPLDELPPGCHQAIFRWTPIEITEIAHIIGLDSCPLRN